MKNILIIGSSGFLGFNLAKKFKSENDEIFIHGVDIVRKTSEGKHKFYFDKFTKINLFDGTWKKGDFNIEYDEIYSFASDSGNMLYLNNSELSNGITYRNHLIFNNIFDALQNKLSFGKFFYASDPISYDTPFFVGKRHHETLLTTWAELNKKSVYIGRLHNTYGRGMSFNPIKISVVGELTRLIYLAKKIKTDFIPIFGDGTQQRSFVYVKDCLNGILNLMNSDVHDPVDITDGKLYTILELSDIMMDCFYSHIPLKYLSRNKIDSQYSNIIRPLSSVTTWTPEYDLVYGLSEFFNYLQRLGYEKILRLWV